MNSLPQIDYTPYIQAAYAFGAGILIAYTAFIFFQRIKIRKQMQLLKKG